MVMELQTINFKIIDHIGRMLISSPPANEMTTSFFNNLASLSEMLGNTPGLQGLIIAGAGRHFSSGANLAELMQHISSGNDSFLEVNRKSLRAISALPFPVIATIQGVCIGSAFEFALHSHFRFCSHDAVLGLPETSFNLIPGLGGIGMVKGLTGESSAVELILSGRTFGAAEALELNLVDHILPKKSLVPVAEDFIRKTDRNYIRDKKPIYLERYFTDHGLDK